MAIKIVPLTQKELIESLQVYRTAFSDWTLEHKIALTRIHGPIKQMIAFQALQSGDYRPSCAIIILLPIPDGCTILHQMLDVRNREISRREHPTKWPLIVKAMEEQFVPSIRKPLDVAETVQIAEEAVLRYPNNIGTHSSVGLAALNAYLRNFERAVFWCQQAEERLAKMGRDLADWEIRKRQFALDLRKAIDSGQVAEYLQS